MRRKDVSESQCLAGSSRMSRMGLQGGCKLQGTRGSVGQICGTPGEKRGGMEGNVDMGWFVRLVE